jgi:exodeoxyribonuclease V alpha subunit
MLEKIEQLWKKDIFSTFDVEFTRFIEKLSPQADDELLLGAILVSHLTAQGNICVNLSTYANRTFPLFPDDNIPENEADFLRCPPSVSKWINHLKNSGIVGSAQEYKPLILNDDKLYLYRYWKYEQEFSASIKHRLKNPCVDIDRSILARSLFRLFPQKQTDTDIDAQRLAAERAVLNNFSIISGGPGTGKTFTIIKILALLLEQNKQLHIALTAPTGKAAARLQESIIAAKQHLDCAPEIKEAIPQETYTVHRLLGTIPHSPYFRKNADNPLPYDVVVVDEASMVDLALMAKLASAIPPHARWILVGDKNQLASVEAGTVFGDICDIGQNEKSYITVLTRNYRFNENSGIGKLARAITHAESDNALNILKSSHYSDIHWRDLKPYQHFLNDLKNKILHSFSEYLQAIRPYTANPDTVLQAFDKFRILCALRHGFYGVEMVNRSIEKLLIREGFLKTGYLGYHGQPIMITHNDYTLKLFNGDVGVILRNPEKRDELLAFFRETDGNIREFLPSRLPQHETVFAMTVHKSQGSEFESILMILPPQFSMVLSRELLYTGITRAKHRLDIWGNEEVFKHAIQQKIQRTSGLKMF